MSYTWWQNGIVYQIYPRSFMDSNGDGVGDLAGIIQKLDYVQDLGVDAIWLSPIFPSPMADFGYDVSDYVDVHPLFGDLATLDQLVAEAHARNLKVVLDYVPNHSSNEHPWFLESRSSRQNPKRDWYIWRDAKPDGSEPNNWLAHFGGKAWTWDETTEQYYLHLFLPEQPDLNWFNPEVETAMMEVLRFWGKRGIDGFRMDVIFITLKHPDLPDLPPAEGKGEGKDMGDFGSLQHIYDNNYPRDRQHRVATIRQTLDEFGAIAIGETYLLNPADLVPYYGENMDGLHLPFNFTLMHLPWEKQAFYDTIQSYYAVLPPQAQPNFVIGSHDEHRFVTRYGAENGRAAGVLLMTLRGTPTWYFGDELGLPNGEVPPDKVQDPWGKNKPELNVGRDPARTPMLWDDSPNAGFTRGEPWLPVHPHFAELSVAAQTPNSESDLNFYKKLFKLRRETPALYGGDFVWVADLPEDVLGYVRSSAGQLLKVLVNFGNHDHVLENEGAEVLLSTQNNTSPQILHAHEALILRLL